jgi:hypothetical protein
VDAEVLPHVTIPEKGLVISDKIIKGK